MHARYLPASLFLLSLGVATQAAAAQPTLIAIGSASGLYEDFAVQTAAPLENGVAGNRFGGLGSGLTYIGGDWFLGLPDRGPNAVGFNGCMDDTVTYINRFQTLHLSLSPTPSDATSPLPVTLTPMLVGTTLLSSRSPLVYGAGCGSVSTGAPPLNAVDHRFYFTGRSDGFDPSQNSGDPHNARFDAESIRVSNDRSRVYVSDEYGPYVYEFDRLTGERVRSFALPSKFFVTTLSAMGSTEIAVNTVGRVANKGMEGLAITPDGRMLVGAMQSPLIQDGGDAKGGITRLVTIDIQTGRTHEYAYQLDTGTKTTISDILAVNDHQFLVDERDSKGRADALGSVAGVKRLYLIDLAGAHDVSGVTGAANLKPFTLGKTLFLDIVAALTGSAAHLDPADIPAKLEGVTFGQNVTYTDPVTHDVVTKHTLFVGNDNDFVATLTPPAGDRENPNQWFVFGFSDADLPSYVPQQFTRDDDRDRDNDHDR